MNMPFSTCLVFSLGLALAAPLRAADPVFDGSGDPSARPSAKKLVDEKADDVPPSGESAGMDTRMWIEVRAADAAARGRLADMGMSIEELGDGTVSGVIDQEGLHLIEEAGFDVIRRDFLRNFGPVDFPPDDSAYHNYEEVAQELSALAGAAPDMAEVFSIGTSHEGRELLALKLSLGYGEKPGMVFMGCHHAREHLSTEVPLLLARYFVEYRDHPTIKRLLETREIYFLPLINPDGSEYDVATGRYRWQRKNMRDNGDGTVGVDLNRNYGYEWGGAGASDRPGSDTYHGPEGFSEPESQAVRDFIRARPNINVAVTYHTYGELVLYPWSYASTPVSDGRARSAFSNMADRMAEMTGYRAMQSADLYPSSGDTCDWAYGERGVFCFTFELSPRSGWNGGFYPGPEAIDSTFQANIEPAVYMTDLADDPYRAADAAVAAAPEGAVEAAAAK